MGPGREGARRFLEESVDVPERIADAVYAAKGLKRAVPAQAPGEEAKAPRRAHRARAEPRAGRGRTRVRFPSPPTIIEQIQTVN